MNAAVISAEMTAVNTTFTLPVLAMALHRVDQRLFRASRFVLIWSRKWFSCFYIFNIVSG